jgi:hypothetical protein
MQPQRLDVPMGVFGYRIDAREHGQPDWNTLVRVRSKAPLTLGALPLGAPGVIFEGELGVEVHSMQLDGDQAAGQFWLPAYMAQWNGKSLVLPMKTPPRSTKPNKPTARPPASAACTIPWVSPPSPALRKTYDFRVRLMDPTGGGPPVTATPIQESPSPIATVPFAVTSCLSCARRRTTPLPDAPLDTLFPATISKSAAPCSGTQTLSSPASTPIRFSAPGRL